MLARSKHWPEVERAFLREHPTCQICGGREDLNVHHRVPVSYILPLKRPELELEPLNLATLCSAGDNHHLLIGHLNYFESFNPNFDTDVLAFHAKNATAIKEDPIWQEKVKQRPKPYIEMTVAERDAVASFLAHKFPEGVAHYTRSRRMRHIRPSSQ